MVSIKKILVIRFRRVGDAVISTVLCSSLRKTFPGAVIDYVLNEGIATLFEHHPDIDHIIRFSNKDMDGLGAYTKKVKQVMKAGRYDLIVDCRSTVKTLWFSLYSLSTPYRIGRKKCYNGILHNYRVDNEGVVDEVTKTLMLLKPLEKSFDVKYERFFKVYVTDREKKDFKNYMQAQGIDFSRPVVICTVVTRLVHKMWDSGRMKEILRRIIDRYDAQLIFNFGGKEEEVLARQLHHEMNSDSRIFMNIEAGNLRELAAMIGLSGFLFGNEGGPRHISQALDIPSFAIYPPGISREQWLPNACERFQGIQPSDISEKGNDKGLSFKEKFDQITVDEVWGRLEPMLTKYLKP